MVPAAADQVVIRSTVPVYELALPDAYVSTVPAENPPRYVRSSGREIWALVMLQLWLDQYESPGSVA